MSRLTFLICHVNFYFYMILVQNRTVQFDPRNLVLFVLKPWKTLWILFISIDAISIATNSWQSLWFLCNTGNTIFFFTYWTIDNISLNLSQRSISSKDVGFLSKFWIENPCLYLHVKQFSLNIHILSIHRVTLFISLRSNSPRISGSCAELRSAWGFCPFDWGRPVEDEKRFSKIYSMDKFVTWMYLVIVTLEPGPGVQTPLVQAERQALSPMVLLKVVVVMVEFG